MIRLCDVIASERDDYFNSKGYFVYLRGDWAVEV